MADVIETIGSGGDHADIAAWLSAHEGKDMTALGNRYIGELIDDVYEVDAGDLVADVTGGGTRDSSNYRWLRSAASAGGYYKPEEHSGPRIYVRWTGTGNQSGFKVAAAESFFRLTNLGIVCEDPQEVSAGQKSGVHVEGDDFLGSRLFVRISDGGQRNDAVNPLFACYFISNGAGSANEAHFLNCIAYGSRSLKGAHFGFFFDFTARNGGCWNCAAYSIRHIESGGAGGFLNFSAAAFKPHLVNCIATDCTAGYTGVWESIAVDPTNSNDPLSVDEPYQCIASDYSLPFDSIAPRPSANLNGVDSRIVFSRPEVQDMRPVFGSVVIGNGRDVKDVWQSFGLPIEDFDGNLRTPGNGGTLSIGWTIGPYDKSYDPLGTTSITIETKSIGSGVGRDYATIEAFLADTDDQSLVFQNKKVIGELYDDSDFALGIGVRVIAQRCVTDARRYREIRPAAGHEYDPVTGNGVRITGQGDGTTGQNNLIEVHEDNFRISGPLYAEQTFSGSANRRVVKIQADSVRVNAVHGKFAGSTGTSNIIFLVRGSRVLLTNCVAEGSNSSGTGTNVGVNIQNCQFSFAYCCTVWGVKGNGGGQGFREGANTDRVEFSSCIAADCTSDFSHAVPANAPIVQSYNVSSDATADGAGSQTGASSSALFRDASGGDFRNENDSTGIKRGRNLVARFSADFLGVQRFAPFDCGAYEGFPVGPAFPAPSFDESHAFVTLWELVRVDGTILLFTDQNEPVIYRGREYGVGGSYIASNRRSETAALSVGVRAALSSAKVTVEDLAAGRYRGARLREILLGRWAWTRPIDEFVYVLGNEIEYDADQWETEFTSVSALLERNAGRVVTISCPLQLGGDECLVDLTPNTIDGVRVSATIDDVRRKFDAEAADISGAYADDYFAKGELVWLTGQAVGVTSQIKSYTSATRTIELEEALSYDIAQNDTFIVKPGCRKRYVLDCITKHSNGIRFGGDPFMPGTDKSLSTPTR